MNPKKIVIPLLSIALWSCTQLSAVNTYGHNFYVQRSQLTDFARRLVGVTPQFLVPCDMDYLNGYVAVVPEYMRSLDSDLIGDYFFFNGTNSMTFGSEDGTGVDVFARNFLLNDQFYGLVNASPQVENFIADFQFRINFDEWVCGLYAELFVPVTWTRWKMSLEETVTDTGQYILANQLGNTVDADSPIGSIITAFNGQILSPNFPDLTETLQYGRIDNSTASGRKSKTGVADIEAAFGYNFCSEIYHVGMDIRGIFPTGNRPESHFLFEPIIGNGKHFEFGGSLTGHYEFWNNSCDSCFGLWLQGAIYHVFKAKQRRIFDLNFANGTQNIGSNRLLIKKYAGGAYADEVLFGPNVLAVECKVSNAVHANAIALFYYKRCDFSLDIGYEFWVLTKDKLVVTGSIPANTYGVAGDSGTAGIYVNNTASQTTISGANAADYDPTNVYISVDSLSLASAIHPMAMSHKVFGNLSYTWYSCDYSPFIGVGGQVEFSGQHNFALSQWGVWIKGGFAFS